MELSAAKSSQRPQTPPPTTSLAEISESQPESTHSHTDVASVPSAVDSGSVSATPSTMQGEWVSAIATSSDSSILFYYSFTVSSTEGLQQHVLQP